MNTQKLYSYWRTSTAYRLGFLICVVGTFACTERLHAQAITISNIWRVAAAADRSYLNSTNDSDRGTAYNPFTGHAYIVSRTGGLQVTVLNADDGSFVTTLSVSGVSGGDFALSQIGVADDGYIYAANLTTSSTVAARPFKIYRWSDESATPVVVYSGSPSGAQTLRFGDAIDVRGGGTNTEIIASTGGVNATNLIAVFRPFDETLTTFTNRAIVVPRGLNVLATDFAKGITFGPGNTFFAKNNGANTSAKLCSYDWESGIGAWIRNYAIAANIASIDYEPGTELLAGVYLGSATVQHALLVYDVSDDIASLIYSNTFSAPLGANGNAVNGVNIYSNRVVAVEPRNGAQMAGIHVSTEPVAVKVIQQPGNLSIVQGGYGSLAVTVSGSKPRSYQWQKDATDVSNATNRILTFTNVPLSASGAYSVTVSNLLGTTNSNSGNLTVTPATLSTVLHPLWRIEPGHPSYPWLLTDSLARGMAYNPVRDHLLVVSRTSSNAIYVLDALTGEPLRTLLVPANVVNGGTFVVNMIACSTDGQVIAANLTTDGKATPFKVYRWPNDDADVPPTVIFSGDPGSGTSERWGDTLDVRGTDVDVDVLVAGRNGKLAACIFSAPDSAFRRLLTINTPDADNGNFGLGITFGIGDTFWGKSSGNHLRHVGFDPVTGAGTVITTITNFPAMASVALNRDTRWLAGLSIETPDNVRLVDVSGPTHRELDTKFFSDYPNANGAGQVRFGRDRLFVLDANNGIVAYTVSPILRWASTGGTLELNWDGDYFLQSATEVTGIYTNVVNEPPYTIEAGSEPIKRAFFRLVPITP